MRGGFSEQKNNNKHVLMYQVIECQWIYKLANMKLSPISNIKNEITKKQCIIKGGMPLAEGFIITSETSAEAYSGILPPI